MRWRFGSGVGMVRGDVMRWRVEWGGVVVKWCRIRMGWAMS